MDQCVLPFDACTAQTAGLVGGKALGLGELQRGGFPVPPGFAITTAAYRASIAPIAREIASIVAITGGVEADEHAAQAIAALFAHVLIPLEIAGEIDAAYASLGANGVPVAVRSSATAAVYPAARPRCVEVSLDAGLASSPRARSPTERG